jgi:hypothetical protein
VTDPVVAHKACTKLPERFGTGFFRPDEKLDTVGNVDHRDEFFLATVYQLTQSVLAGGFKKTDEEIESIIWHFQLILINPAQQRIPNILIQMAPV